MSILIVQVFEKPTQVTVLLGEFEAATFGQPNAAQTANFSCLSPKSLSGHARALIDAEMKVSKDALTTENVSVI